MATKSEIEGGLTQEKAQELWDYDEDSGVFVWRRQRNSRAPQGVEAGSLDKADGYRLIRYNRLKYRAHRLAWFYTYGVWPKDQIDHINGDKDDNRLCNLREADASLNARNRRLQSNSKSGVMGVYYDTFNKKWRAQIKPEGVKLCLGRYTHKEDAIAARKSADEKYGFHANHGNTVVQGER
jgi:hypothetical protein